MSHGLSDIQLSSLRARAVAAKATAYCPYSKFRVGAAVLDADGTLTAGANVENAAYPVGTCAERVALARAVTERPGLVFSQQAPLQQQQPQQQQGEKEEKEEEGEKKGPVLQFKALAVATDSGTPASPCGMCRQFIREFCALDMPVFMFDKDENYVVRTLQELLPLSFGPEDLVRA